MHRLKPAHSTLGRREVQRVTPDTCAKVGHDLGPSAFIALRRVLSFAVRRGYLTINPCGSLERGERPSAKSGEVIVLTPDEFQRLIDKADATTRPLLVTAALSGLGQSELLALRWQDVDFNDGVIRVRHQLSRGSASSPARLETLKTDLSAREVVLVPALAVVLREHRAQAMQPRHHSPESFLFSTRDGKPLSQRNATRSLTRIARAARDGKPLSQRNATRSLTRIARAASLGWHRLPYAEARLRVSAHRRASSRPGRRVEAAWPRAAEHHARPLLAPL